MSELPEGIPPAEAPTPRDSASGIVSVASGDGTWRVLLGRRSARSRFMPGHLAFPGGVMDSEDRPGEPGAWERCATREMREETGLEIPEAAWHAAGERVTPPMFPVRFRTRFFVAELPPTVTEDSLAPSNRENDRLELLSPRSVLEAWADGRVKIPPPVLPLLRALDEGAGGPIEEIAAAVHRANDLEERTPRIEFVPDVWAIPLRTATLPPATHTNAWMPGGRRFVIVDPGTDDPSEVDRLLACVARRRESGHDAIAVLLTHGHRDHVGGALKIAESLGCCVRAHPAVLDGLGRASSAVERRPLNDGDEIDLDGMTLRALDTPGHASGHLAYLLVEPRLLVAGDLVSGMSTILIDPVTGDMEAYLASLARVRALDCRMLLPGHGPPLPGRQLERLIEHRARREARIRDELSSQPATLSAIASAVYTDVPEMPARLTETQTLSHLIRLERIGQSRRADADGDRWESTGSGAEAARQAQAAETVGRIEAILRRRFKPQSLELTDDSARHAGHRGATSGGGHFQVDIVSAEFEGRTRVEQHRLVYEALAALIPSEIHALGLETRAPSERSDSGA